MKELSIVIPYYKGSNFIFNCIDSLLESYALSQKKILFEIIVIIDSPDEYIDNHIDILSHYNCPDFINIIVNKRNMGVALSRNKGLAASRYNYVTFIDQDDQVMSGYFNILSDFLNNNCHCVIMNGYWHIQNGLYKKLYHIKPDLTFDAVLRKTFCVWTPGLMILNKEKIQIEPFFFNVSEKYTGCDDWIAILNMLLKYPQIKFHYIKIPVFIINRHAINFSNDQKQMLLCQIEGLKYFRKLVVAKKQKMIDRLIKIREFQLTKIIKPLSKIEILQKYKKVYMQYLLNKWGYLKYPLYKTRKTWDEIINHEWVNLKKN
jgi:glycosyltransferase involved in cell wall biosynthesis